MLNRHDNKHIQQLQKTILSLKFQIDQYKLPTEKHDSPCWELFEELSNAYLELAKVYEIIEDWPNCVDTYYNAILLNYNKDIYLKLNLDSSSPQSNLYLSDSEQLADNLFIRGLQYLSGYGCKQDPAKAVDCIQKAAYDLNDTHAINMLGFMYFTGLGVEPDLNKGFKLYKQAADKKFVPSIYNLGQIYLKYADNSETNHAMAYYYFQQAAALGSSDASSSLGYMYLTGLAVERNYVDAVKHYRQAANMGSSLALRKLELLYQQDHKGFTPDFALCFRQDCINLRDYSDKMLKSCLDTNPDDVNCQYHYALHQMYPTYVSLDYLDVPLEGNPTVTLQNLVSDQLLANEDSLELQRYALDYILNSKLYVSPDVLSRVAYNVGMNYYVEFPYHQEHIQDYLRLTEHYLSLVSTESKYYEEAAAARLNVKYYGTASPLPDTFFDDMNRLFKNIDKQHPLLAIVEERQSANCHTLYQMLQNYCDNRCNQTALYDGTKTRKDKNIVSSLLNNPKSLPVTLKALHDLITEPDNELKFILDYYVNQSLTDENIESLELSDSMWLQETILEKTSDGEFRANGDEYATCLPSSFISGDVVNCNNSNFSIFSTFKPNKKANKAQELLEFVLFPSTENIEKLVGIAKTQPSLFIDKINNDVTPFEAALMTGDTDLCNTLAPYLAKVNNGQIEMLKQMIHVFAEKDFDMSSLNNKTENELSILARNKIINHDEKQKKTAYAFDMLAPLISKATYDQIKAQLNHKDYPSPLNKAILAFRKELTMQYQNNPVHNRYHLLKAMEIITNRKVSEFSYHSQYYLIWRQIIGYTQRFMPINLMQAFCTGLYDLICEKDPRTLERNTKILNDENKNYISLDKIDEDPTNRVGFDVALSSYHQRDAQATSSMGLCAISEMKACYEKYCDAMIASLLNLCNLLSVAEDKDDHKSLQPNVKM